MTEGAPPQQGDLGLLESDIAKRLLSSRLPARFAYIASDGTPRIVATWFHWTGSELVMPTFISAPHVSHSASRLRALRGNPVGCSQYRYRGLPARSSQRSGYGNDHGS